MDAIQNFQLFCLEGFRSTKGISGEEALAIFEEYGVFSFLQSGYDMLHTQSQGYILAEIDRFIAHHD